MKHHLTRQAVWHRGSMHSRDVRNIRESNGQTIGFATFDGSRELVVERGGFWETTAAPLAVVIRPAPYSEDAEELSGLLQRLPRGVL